VLPTRSPGPSYPCSRLEVGAGEPPPRDGQRLLVVGVYQLDAVAMGKAVILGVEVAAVIQLRLAALVVQHRVHAVLVRQAEIQHLELDRQHAARVVGLDRDLAAVDARLARAIDVDLDPDGLVLVRAYRHRQPAAPAPGVFGHQLHRLPARRIGRRRRGIPVVHPRRMRRRRDLHVVDGEDLDRPVDELARIERRRQIDDAIVAGGELGETHRELADPAGVRFDDHLEGDDLVAGAEDLDGFAVPDGVAHRRRVSRGVPLDLVAVADGPDPPHIRTRVPCEAEARNRQRRQACRPHRCQM
jgi:hypothetical protein